MQNKKEVRDFLIEEIVKEFFGPGSEVIDSESKEYERISESPLKRYYLGVLYPQKAFVGEGDYEPYELPISNRAEEEKNEIDEENGEIENEEEKNKTIKKDDEYWDNAITSANQYCPSSFGFSFFVEGKAPEIKVEAKAARYEKLSRSESFVLLKEDEQFVKDIPAQDAFEINKNKFFFNEYIKPEHREQIKKTTDKYIRFSRIYDKAKNFETRGYKRIPCSDFYREKINLDRINNYSLYKWPNENLGILIKVRHIKKDNLKKVTISIINKNEIDTNSSKFSSPEKSYFQNELSIEVDGKNTKFTQMSKLKISHLSNKSDELLYRDRKIFAAGHGCSVDYEQNEPTKIYSNFIPAYEVPQVNPNPKRIANLDLNIFNMKNLAYASNMSDKEIVEELKILIDDYKQWINGERAIPDEYLDVFEKNKKNSKLIIERLETSVDQLTNSDSSYMQAFRLANLAMLMQRAHTEKYYRNNEELADFIKYYNAYKHIPDKYVTWRPFQLAFFILTINSIVNENSDDRKIADLLWFPTGGGKTEAYLGVIAFTIFHRKLSDKGGLDGTIVIMRYTLRLLTAQQFERATTLICACEFIRRHDNNISSASKIDIGLWVGRDNTPNNKKGASDIIRKLADKRNINRFKEENPFQLTYCPWCGHKLLNEDKPLKSGYVDKSKFFMKCINSECEFTDELPVQVIDELIYKSPPSLLFATVDKFARLAWDPNTRTIFGYNSKNKSTERVNKPPELILQDELHLISGPLGSLFGIYETIIDFLSSSGKVSPKIICSTATIQKAEEQIKSLFNRKTHIFPHALDKANENYFSEEIPLEKKPGRTYLGLLAVGQTRQSALVKAYYTLLYNNVSSKIPTEFKDSYYTLVSYFNTINELGIASSLLDDDVKEKLKMIQDRKREIFRRSVWYSELTSRLKSKQLPILLDRISRYKYSEEDKRSAIPVVLTTNMFSVGIDISRINLMLLAGQPKSNAEYIQATSRVGRNDPGLVLVMFDGYRPRDKSHYENFVAFHSSFYRFVEPTGVTPFSVQTRSRALHTLLVIAARLIYGLPENKDATNIEYNTIKDEFFNFIKNRVDEIDTEESENTYNELKRLVEHWCDKKSETLVYSINIPKKAGRQIREEMERKQPLIYDIARYYAGVEIDAWPVLQSLRNVDVPTVCKLEE